MPDREIKIRVTLDGLQDASQQAGTFSGSVRDVGAAAAEATAAAAPLGAAVDTAGASLKTAGLAAYEMQGTLADKLAPAANAARDAFDKLGNTQGVRGLSMAIAQSQVAMQGFKTATDAAVASGEKLSPQVGFALKAMGTEIDAATQKLGMLRKAQADVAASSALAGSQLDALRTRAGSLTGMFDSMERTGTGLTKTIGQVGLGMGIAGIAFAGAEAAGNALSKVLLAIEARYSALLAKQAAAVDAENLMANALRAVSEGHIKAGNNIQETIRNYELYIASSGKAGIATAEFVAEMAKITPPKNLAEATADVAIFASVLDGLMKKSPEEVAVFLAAHKDMVDKIQQYYATLGQRLPAEFKQIVDAQKNAVAAQKLLTEQGAADAIAAFAKIAAARTLADAVGAKSTLAAVKNAEDEMRALNAESVSADEYSKRKKAIYEAETTAVAAAASAQALAAAKSELDQAKLQKDLGVTGVAFTDVAKASADYAKDLASGAKPAEALTKAAEGLQRTIEATREALPQLNSNLDKLVTDGMKKAEGQAKAAAEQQLELVKAMKKAEDGAGTLGVAITVLNGILDTFGVKTKVTKDKLNDLSDLMGNAGMG